MNKHILVVGSLNMDLVVRTPRHPLPGETVLGSDFMTFPGGKGANQAVAASRMGASVRMIGRVGNDSFGDVLLETLQRDGVDITSVMRDAEAPTGVALITVDTGGQNTIVVASGANACLSPEDVTAHEDSFRNASVLLLQLESPLASVERAIELAHKHNVRIVLNPAPAQTLDPSLLACVDYLVPNQTELAILADVAPDIPVPDAVDQLRTMGAGSVIVTLGEEGVLICDNDQKIPLASHPVNVVDATAAGDAFIGAFAVALLEQRPVLEAARFGNAAGAITVSRAGAQPSLPVRAEVEQLLDGAES